MHLKIFKFIYITLRMQEINPAELFSRGHSVYAENGNMENVKNVFCTTLSEFENFPLCERILINLTTCQNETSS
jgi:hypothetical protein